MLFPDPEQSSNCLHKGTFPNQTFPLCYIQLVAASCSYYSDQDGLDPLQLALLVISCKKLMQRLMVLITCNLYWWYFFQCQLTLVCTWMCIATCTIAVWQWWWLITYINNLNIQSITFNVYTYANAFFSNKSSKGVL